MGLDLKTPIIVSSSGLTMNTSRLIEIERQGAGAVVLKSLFEEQIMEDGNATFKESGLKEKFGDEAEAFIKDYVKRNSIKDYISLINEAKQNVNIPIIASINCDSAEGWTEYAKNIEEAGADAIEINVSILPADFHSNASEIEKQYFDIVQNIRLITQLPIALKINSYFSAFANFSYQISNAGISGLVLFNRYFSPDIDIEKETIKSANILSSKEDSIHTLRWIALLSKQVNCNLSASTGVHDGETLIKFLLAGADSVQICSAIYKSNITPTITNLNPNSTNKGKEYSFEIIAKFKEELTHWMEKHNYSSIQEFKGKLSFKNTNNHNAYCRTQFMKHYGGME